MLPAGNQLQFTTETDYLWASFEDHNDDNDIRFLSTTATDNRIEGRAATNFFYIIIVNLPARKQTIK